MLIPYHSNRLLPLVVAGSFYDTKINFYDCSWIFDAKKNKIEFEFNVILTANAIKLKNYFDDVHFRHTNLYLDYLLKLVTMF